MDYNQYGGHHALKFGIIYSNGGHIGFNYTHTSFYSELFTFEAEVCHIPVHILIPTAILSIQANTSQMFNIFLLKLYMSTHYHAGMDQAKFQKI